MYNRLWEPALEELVREAVKELGVKRNLVKAKFATLLINKAGGCLKTHLKEGAAGGKNFATLIVQLPSQFTGGAFVVSSQGIDEKRKFTMGTDTDDAAYGCHYFCHYNDCTTHEMQPVETGRRLLLIYSLCYLGATNNQPSASQFDYSSLSWLLQKFPTNDSVFLVPMERHYKTASLSGVGASALMGADRAKQEAITTAGRGLWRTVIARAPFFVLYQGGDDNKADYGFHEDGSSAWEERTWMHKIIDTRLVGQGGMLFGKSKLEELLKITDSCVLISYSTDFGNSVKLKEIYDEYAKLVRRTSGGVPTFSWCIPNAQTPNATITEFLRSPRSGPERVTIGGGVDNVRQLRFLRGEKLIPKFEFFEFRAYRARTFFTTAIVMETSSPMLPRVDIKADTSPGRGSKNSVVVTKTRSEFDRQVEQYQTDMGTLAKTIADIRKLGGRLPTEPTLDSALPHTSNTTNVPASINLPLAELIESNENPEPAKKRHKTAHVPVDAENAQMRL